MTDDTPAVTLMEFFPEAQKSRCDSAASIKQIWRENQPSLRGVWPESRGGVCRIPTTQSVRPLYDVGRQLANAHLWLGHADSCCLRHDGHPQKLDERM